MSSNPTAPTIYSEVNINTVFKLKVYGERGLKTMDVAFLGGCKGIGLTKRDKDDPHVMWTVLTEDDETWYLPSTCSSSSYWLPELKDAIAAAQAWMEENCKKTEWGYEFNDKPKVP